MLVLGIESSCDETSAAIAENGRIIRSNLIASQIELHRVYGGVVPEIASRAHTEAISGLVYGALEQAGAEISDIDAIAVTNTPGLIGALLVGVSFAKGLALTAKKPLIAVNHIKGHVAANYFVYPDLKPPFLALVVSGGHTSILDVRSYTEFITIGRTRDDAAGEAFDKAARVMGLPYPGGAEMDKLASLGNQAAIAFPSAAMQGDTLDFSFSGLKTAVLNYLNGMTQKGLQYSKEDVAASFTLSVTEAVVRRIAGALRHTGYSDIVLAGGVAANSHLRRAIAEYARQNGCCVYLPPLALCGDNAAMIAAQGYYEYLEGNYFQAGSTALTSLNAFATAT